MLYSQFCGPVFVNQFEQQVWFLYFRSIILLYCRRTESVPFKLLMAPNNDYFL